jgi:GntR family transcriptional regulator
MFQLDMKSRRSIYEQVVENLKEMIRSRVLVPDEKLPSVRELSRILTVNPNTVQKAYRELERMGYVYSSAGLGTFVKKVAPGQRDEILFAQGKSRLREAMQEIRYAGLSHREMMELVKELGEEFERRDQ